MLLTFSFIGYLCDSAFAQFQLINFSHAIEFNIFDSDVRIAPLWLLMLWLSFATCLNHSLRFLQGKYLLCLLTVLFTIPLNYALGAHLTQSEFLKPISWVLTYITIYWLLLLPITMANFARKTV